jgi:hypothetical protein
MDACFWPSNCFIFFISFFQNFKRQLRQFKRRVFVSEVVEKHFFSYLEKFEPKIYQIKAKIC